METAELYQIYKPLLFAIAYRMTGSVMDAEDIIHESFLAFSRLDNEKKIENEKAYLCRMVMNSSIDKLRSAASKREVYVGEWLPEPIVEEANDPTHLYLMKESISTAYLLLLQQLSEVERAVFLLREVFQYSYEEIGDIVEKSATNCRQIYHRSKKSITSGPKASTLDFQSMKSSIEQFTLALQKGNIEKMLELIRTDAVFISDGGGKVTAALKPIYTSARIISLFSSILKKLPEDYKLEFKDVNGSPGVILTINGTVAYVLSFEFQANQIARIFMVANPDKLGHLQIRA
ncbi:RNA polymerase sigma-70 factor [Neobacillus sp. NPDC058068]|uniref:RNA polymerase sigma-70 factor n=1 Tax=Neobacillus sp. NPDC058068 TaxID=3346325 RepID=UPI0036D93887